ncbi:hypothetical protein RDWZM_000587, partial [Blomia tropicalis]
SSTRPRLSCTDEPNRLAKHISMLHTAYNDFTIKLIVGQCVCVCVCVCDDEDRPIVATDRPTNTGWTDDVHRKW